MKRSSEPMKNSDEIHHFPPSELPLFLQVTSGRWTIISSPLAIVALAEHHSKWQVIERSVQMEMSVQLSWAIRHGQLTSAPASLTDDFRSRLNVNSPIMRVTEHLPPAVIPQPVGPVEPLSNQTSPSSAQATSISVRRASPRKRFVLTLVSDQ